MDVVTFSLIHYLSNSFLVFHYLYFNELSPNFVGSFSQSLGFIPFIDLENFNFLDVTSNFKGLFLTNIYDLGLLFFTLSFFLIFILRFIYFPLIFRLISSFFGFFFFASSFFGSPLVYSYFFLGVIYTIIFLPIFIKSVKNA